MMLKKLFFIGLFFGFSFQAMSEQIVYTSADSIKVVNLLTELKTLPERTDRIAYFARKFLGTPYVGGTLEREKEESLIVNLSELDCTTFVETVLALTLASGNNNDDGFQDFLDALKKVRYRDGKIEGYPSRLHYFSEWIYDNEQKRILRERSKDLSRDSLRLDLFYMTAHADKYPALRNNPGFINKIAEREAFLKDRTVYYISKEVLPFIADKIETGDIIAITTNIKGLDISHVGFAVWDNEQLCLLHASSIHKKVIIEPLLEYIKNKKAQTGIRVISVLKN